jgi:2-oxo-3-hexenedioate decarboxylase
VNPKIESGTRAMLAQRKQRLAGGEEPLGWKVGFGSQAAFERLGTDRPLAGFLLRSGLLEDGATVDIGGWENPHLELEVAAYIGEDLAIAGVSSAIELVDTTPISTDPDEILRGNIYHRHVILGPLDEGKRDGQGVTARLLKDGEELARADDPQAATGEIVAVVAGIRELLNRFGADFRPGDVIITGSAFPPVPVSPGRYTTELPPLGALRVDLLG